MIHTRTIREAAAWFKDRNPETALTETAIRTLLQTGKVPCVRVGKKYLVTLEALETYLSGQLQVEPRAAQEGGKRVWKIQ